MRVISIRSAIVVLLASVLPAQAVQAQQGLDKLSHILVLYLENRSFDNIFGEFPGANGLANAGEAAVQRDREGAPFSVLPRVEGPFEIKSNPEPVFKIGVLDDLPNRPFPIVGIRSGITA